MTQQRFAVHIMAHTEPALFADLAASLQHEDVDVFAHIDAKVDQRPFVDAAPERVEFVVPRLHVGWGGFSQVRATMELLATAGEDYHRHSLLSGSDVLIRPLDDVLDAWSGDAEMIRIDHDLQASIHGHWTKVARYHFPDHPRLGRFSGRIPRRVPQQYRLAQGSTWWSLTGPAISHLRAQLAQEREWLQFFRYSLCPDEYVFHSLFAASPFAANISTRAHPDVHGQHFIDWADDGWHPNEFTEADLPRARASGAFFARKVGAHWTWRGQTA